MFYDGKVSGKFLSLKKDEKIEKEWKLREWEKPSIVEITLIDYEEDKECDMILK